MTPEFVITVGREAMRTAFFIAAPPLIAALVVGLVVSIFQAVTQIQEMTLAIIPTMFAVLLSFLISFPCFLAFLTTYHINFFLLGPPVFR